jgi:autotransporter-associated beta strand protein
MPGFVLPCRAGSLARSAILALTLVAAGGAQAQTGIWATAGGGYWSTASFWSNNVIPNGVGQWALISGNNNLGAGFAGTPIITQDVDVTLGFLVMGDTDRGTAFSIRGPNATTSSTLTFDTGDGRMALLSHGSSDLNRDIGNGSDFLDVGISVADAQGLYIENYQHLIFRGGTTNSRAFDGGGYDVVKAEDGYIQFRNIITNVNNLFVRDGYAEIYLEGDAAMRPDIQTVVVGVAPGTLDTGALNPIQTIVKTGEGGANDRTQLPFFQIFGDNNTNAAGRLTNTFDIVLNRGAFRTFSRQLATTAFRANWTNHQAVFTGDITLNGAANESFIMTEVQDAGNLTSSVRQTLFTGSITGAGGFTKYGNGEMTLLGTNDFTGSVNLMRAFDRGRGRYGSIGLREGGIMTGVAGFNILRDGGIYIDNSGVNIADRINDDAWILNQSFGRFEILGNGLAPSVETIGSVTNRAGWMIFELDTDDASPQASTLNLARLVRDPGTVVSFHASDVRQGAWATNAGAALTVNLLDGGASLAQVGGGGAAGQVNRSLAVGVFGGDASDITSFDNPASDPVGYTASRADEFMTVDGGRLRTLLDSEMVHLGNRDTNTLTITQADAATDANVNIAFRSSQVNVNSAANGVGGEFNLIKNRIAGDVTWNSLRLGVATNYTGAGANDVGGRTVLLDHGGRLTLESGMLLVGRDTRSARGDDTPGGTLYLWRGTIDLDGTANDREGIIQSAAGVSLVVNSRIEALNGLTKSGDNYVYLDKANAIAGTVSVPQGALLLRDPGALGTATQVTISGTGQIRMQWGGSYSNATIVVNPLPYGNAFLYSEAHHNVWNGDIRLNLTDEGGFTHHEPSIRSGENNQNPTLTITGDIALDGATPLSDVYLIDPSRLSFSGSSGIINLKGVIGDVFVNGEADTYDATLSGRVRVEGGDFNDRSASENSILRVRIDGPAVASYGDELAVNIYRPWRATGRLYAEQGTIRYLGDPGAGEGDFWTAKALTNANFANGLSGFVLGEAGTDSGGSVTFLLTKDGQALNAERFTIGNNIANNTITLGLEHFGPTNVTVKVGNSYNDGSTAGDDNRITFDREFRVYSHNGWDSFALTSSVGRINVVQTLSGNGNATLTKVGNGAVYLQGPDHASYDEANNVSRFVLLGGELVLDRSVGSSADTGLQRSRGGTGAALVLAGGDLTHIGAGHHQTEWLSSNLLVRAGDSTIRQRTVTGGSNSMYIANMPAQTVTRQQGGTVNFEKDLSAGGDAAIYFGRNPSARIGSWAVFSSNGMAGGTWAETDIGTNVSPFTAYAVGTYAPGLHSDVVVNPGFGANAQTASLRFNDGAWMGLGGNQIDVTEGGILITENASDGLGGMSSIDVGSLTSSGGEMILHNYNTSIGFGIGADIVGPVALTHSGLGRTTLTGNNTFEGIVYLNGGFLAIDNATRLGNTTNSLELRGGVLEMTANMDLGNRRITVGGDGGNVYVAPGLTGTISGSVSSETNFYSATRQNNGHGDFIKSGAGALVWSGAVGVSNWIQGAIDVREGSLIVARPTLTNEIFGTSHSYYDGTIVRGGASLVINTPTNAGNATTDFREWLTLEQGATLSILDPDAGFQSRRWNAPVNFLGDATVHVQNEDFSLNPDAGYLEGMGALSKSGNGSLLLRQYSPDFTGALEVRDGAIDIYTSGPFHFPNASGITIGHNANTNHGLVAFRIRPEQDGIAKETIVPQNITVVGESDATRLGIFRADHNDSIRFTGNIDLSGFNNSGNNRNFQLWRGDDGTGQRTAEGGDTFEERAFVWIEGDISGGDKRIRTVIEPGGSPNTQDKGAQVVPEPNLYVVWTLSGTNAGWTGTLEVGSRNGTSAGSQGPDLDKEHFVRFGRDDGLATLSISSNNIVVMRHDSHLQAFGSQVTIGTLMTDGKADNETTDYYGNDPTTNAWIENAGTLAGSFRIVQQTNSILRATIRDGTYWSPTGGDQAAAALSITKDGPATLTLDRAHTYSGTTRVMAGMLALTGTASIANSPVIQVDAGAVVNVTDLDGGSMTLASGQTLKGEGMFDGGLIVASGATVAPGSSPGVLTTTGDVEFQSGSTFSVEIIGTLAGQADQLLMSGIGDTLTLGGATLLLTTPNVLPVSSAFIIIDGFSVLSGTFAGLPNSGDTVATANNTFEIQYNANDITLTVVPEPGTLGFIGLAGLLGWLARRRRS